MAQESQNYDDWIEEIRPKIQIRLEQLDRDEKGDGEIVIAQLQEKLNDKQIKPKECDNYKKRN
jgi:antitoxin ParD1/3/4